MNRPVSALTGLEGERIALCDVNVSAVLQDLLAEVTVCQTYRNEERVNIEAVYTFPLPLDAVLLDLEVAIGERVLKGRVVEKTEAEESYEDALQAGDSAVMLETIEPGLYTLNVGNLLPRETAKITFRYALLYRWTGDRVRLFLPTTIAPRYGDSPHQPHQMPEASLTVENQFSLRLEAMGALRDAQFVCPSHAVQMKRTVDKAVLTLQQKRAVMDRDFILSVKAPRADRNFVLTAPDRNGSTAIASFQPFFPGLQQPKPLALAIVIDCSGSMAGDSMAQAKQALDTILQSLQPQDEVALVAFGTSTNLLSSQLLRCSKTNIAKARKFAASLDANLGGTEIANALRQTYAILGKKRQSEVFLLTDGEVAGWESVVDEAEQSSHRFFTVGIGSAVSEAFVRGLATATLGECELVSPNEDMADRVFRHFERMRAPRAKRAMVHWPAGAHNLSPSNIGAVFEGDTVVASASFQSQQIDGSAILEVETEDGEVFRQELALGKYAKENATDALSTVARVAAARRLRDVDAVEGLETALAYQLISPWTNWLVFAERAEEEQAQHQPVLRKVPQTMAAGWGGLGAQMSFLACSVADPLPQSRMASSMHSASNATAAEFEDDFPSRPLFAKTSPPPAYRRLLELIEMDRDWLKPDRALELLAVSGLFVEFSEILTEAGNFGLGTEDVAREVVVRILESLQRGLLSDSVFKMLSKIRKRSEKVEIAIGGRGHAARMSELRKKIDHVLWRL